MFIKITHNNGGNTREALINLDNVASAGLVNKPTTEKLYDENGDFVEERETEKEYVVVLNNGFAFHMNETQYADFEKQVLSK